MARSEQIVVGEAPVRANVSVYRGETKTLALATTNAAVVLTASATAGGAPLVEIPGAAGSIVITPSKVSSLTEGKSYQMNIWDVDDTADPVLLVSGKLTTSNTIAPTGVEYATQFLAGANKVVVLTQSEYDALGSYDGSTLYVITE